MGTGLGVGIDTGRWGVMCKLQGGQHSAGPDFLLLCVPEVSSASSIPTVGRRGSKNTLIAPELGNEGLDWNL